MFGLSKDIETYLVYVMMVKVSVEDLKSTAFGRYELNPKCVCTGPLVKRKSLVHDGVFCGHDHSTESFDDHVLIYYGFSLVNDCLFLFTQSKCVVFGNSLAMCFGGLCELFLKLVAKAVYDEAFTISSVFCNFLKFHSLQLLFTILYFESFYKLIQTCQRRLITLFDVHKNIVITWAFLFFHSCFFPRNFELILFTVALVLVRWCLRMVLLFVNTPFFA